MPRRKPHGIGCAVILSATLGLVSPAGASRPGTPNDERAEVIGPHSIRVSWHDTTSSHDFVHGPQVNFEVEALAPTSTACAQFNTRSPPANWRQLCGLDQSSGYLSFADYDPATRNHWDAGGLAAGRQHCFKIWSRNRDDDMRSNVPTAPACADLPPDMAAAPGAPMYPGQIAAMHRQTLWLGIDGNGVMRQLSDGFVLAIDAGRACRAPWQAVHYINGGFPALPSGHQRAAADPYWLCWSAMLPNGASVTPAGPPPPRPAPPIRAPLPAPPIRSHPQ